MYLTLSELKSARTAKRINQLLDDVDGSGSEEHISAINSAYETCENFARADVNAYLTGVTSVPFSDNAVPQKIKTIMVEIVMYYIHSRRGGVIPEEVTKAKESSLRTLELFARGVLVLDDDSRTDKKATTVRTNRQNRTKVFSDSVLESYKG